MQSMIAANLTLVFTLDRPCACYVAVEVERDQVVSSLMGSSKGMKSYGRYGAVGLELLLSIAVGYYGGRWLDGKCGTKWIAFVGFVIGCYAGFRALFRVAKTMQKDIERDEALERGEDPWAPPSKPDVTEGESDDDAIQAIKSELKEDKK